MGDGKQRVRDAAGIATAMLTAALSDTAEPSDVLMSYLTGSPAVDANLLFDVAILQHSWVRGLMEVVDPEPEEFLRALGQAGQQ